MMGEAVANLHVHRDVLTVRDFQTPLSQGDTRKGQTGPSQKHFVSKSIPPLELKLFSAKSSILRKVHL